MYEKYLYCTCKYNSATQDKVKLDNREGQTESTPVDKDNFI